MASEAGTFFDMSVGLCMSSLEKCLFRSFAHFLKIGVFVFELYEFFTHILEIKPFSEVSVANMFFHMVGSLFILMMFSLAVQKLFKLMRSHLFRLFSPCPIGYIGENFDAWDV